MPKPTVYLETSVIGCLTNWPSRDIKRESHRQSTLRWWNEQRKKYELFVSQVVLDECSKGDRKAIQDRADALKGIPLLAVNRAIADSAAALVRVHALPPKALQDAFHIAIAAHHQIDYLLTWNCAHIANPHIIRQVRRFFDAAKLPMSEITTPEAMLGDHDAGPHD